MKKLKSAVLVNDSLQAKFQQPPEIKLVAGVVGTSPLKEVINSLVSLKV